MTHRQFLAWCNWMQDEWNRPDRSDHYQMQTALEVRRVLMDDKSSVQLNDMKVEFEHRKKITKEQQQNEDRKRVETSKSRWRGFLKLPNPKDG